MNMQIWPDTPVTDVTLVTLASIRDRLSRMSQGVEDELRYLCGALAARSAAAAR
jgi:hypothetical protein